MEARGALKGTPASGAAGSGPQRPRPLLPGIGDGKAEQQRESGDGDARNHDDDDCFADSFCRTVGDRRRPLF